MAISLLTNATLKDLIFTYVLEEVRSDSLVISSTSDASLTMHAASCSNFEVLFLSRTKRLLRGGANPPIYQATLKLRYGYSNQKSRWQLCSVNILVGLPGSYSGGALQKKTHRSELDEKQRQQGVEDSIASTITSPGESSVSLPVPAAMDVCTTGMAISDPTYTTRSRHYMINEELWRSVLQKVGGIEDPAVLNTPFLLANAVDIDVFNQFIHAIDESNSLPKSYIRFVDGNVYIYELPCQQHEAPLRYISTQLVRYNDGFGSNPFQLHGSTRYSIGLQRMEADETLRLRELRDQLPVAAVEIGWSETLWELHVDTQRWVGPDSIAPYPQVCLVVKIFEKRQGGTFAAVAGLYERGTAPLLVNGDTPPTWCTSFGTAAPTASSLTP